MQSEAATRHRARAAPAAASNVGLATNLVPALYDHSNMLRVTEIIPTRVRTLSHGPRTAPPDDQN